MTAVYDEPVLEVFKYMRLETAAIGCLIN